MQGNDWYWSQELIDGVSNCFNSSICTSKYRACSNDSLHPEVRYTESSAAWVLIAAIIVFFMKAGFMLLEVSFARSPEERRYVVVLKHQDAFASAFGFFLLGYDVISHYLTNFQVKFFRITDPILWFFKFTFASNTATIIGGCLVTNKYKLRMPAAFVSAFVISGIIHPVVARIIWSDNCDSLSPYRFCNYLDNPLQKYHHCSWNCSTVSPSFSERIYVLDFAGGGAVHLIGGTAGLVLCLFAKFNDWRLKRKEKGKTPRKGIEPPEKRSSEGFWDWLYPPGGGQETVSDAALGVLILWFSWFAFNCGSSESIETGFRVAMGDHSTDRYPFYGIPAVIAINMIMAGAAGGTLAIAIAIWAQVRYRTASMNANQIANGVFSALVSITAGCAFVDYWGAVLIGMIGVVIYHIGCYLEYLFKIEDTARVIPVHGLCGLWSVIATGLFLFGNAAHCNLHAAFEGLCYCRLRLPHLSYVERLGAQVIGALVMIGVGLMGSFIMYFTLYIIPIKPFVWFFDRVLFLSPRRSDGTERGKLIYEGGWLLTHPDEDFGRMEARNESIVVKDQEPAQDHQHTLLTQYRNMGNVAINYGSTEAGMGEISYRGPSKPEGQDQGARGVEDTASVTNF